MTRRSHGFRRASHRISWGGALSAELPPRWKHDEDLNIRYAGLRALTHDPADWTGFGAVTLDEILPHEHGCSHEIGFLAGSLTVVSRDLTAAWTEADCPDK
ncbi:hypothetical protein [Amycolatopsis sp. La24]|uniref:hypothetical protein n=1 Tax=Amycolatopsis sp. La24 TaxID=3028304 RepID=UPI0023B09849|nr:hypothetical protein [Amycolatopsis sp. La24]